MAPEVRCAVLLPVARCGGHEAMLIEWLRVAVARYGLRPTLVCSHEAQLLERCAAAQLPVAPQPYPGDAARGVRRRLIDFAVSWRAIRALPRGLPILLAPGLVQSNPQHLLAALLLRRRVACYVPMAFGAAQLGLPWARARDAIVAPLAARVALWLTITPQQAELLRRVWHVRVPVQVIPNRLALLSRPAAPRAAAVPDAPLRVRYIGRFDRHQKGLDWLAGVLREQAGRRPWLRMSFQGEGEFEPELRRLAGLQDAAVEVLPWGDVGRGLQDTDVLLLASRYEGLPLVAVEAAHQGVAVVASTQSGLDDVLPPSCLYAFGDAPALLRALEGMREPGARAAAAAAAGERLGRLLAEPQFDEAVRAAVRAIGALGG